MKIHTLILLANLAGCATTHTQPPLLISHDEPSIVLRRADKFVGAGCTDWVKMDGVEIGTVEAGGSLFIKTQPGIHTLEVGAKCSLSQEPRVRREVEVQDRIVRLKYTTTGMGKALIPIYGFFVTPETVILPDTDLN